MKFKKFFCSLFCAFAVMLGLSACADEKPEQPNEATFEVIFETDGGNEISSLSLTEAGKISQPEDPKRNGYVFEGWYKNSSKTSKWDFDTDVVSKNTTIYAKWAKILTCKEATTLCEPDGFTSTERYYIRGTVETISNPTYGEMTISDETGSLYVYGTYSSDGKLRYSELEDKPFAGDEVFLSGILKNFKGQAELSSAWIVEFKHNEEKFDESAYTKMTVAEARNVAKDSKIILEGVVAKITYANGMVPSGFYLVDSTSSIYIYDSQIVPRVEVGNKVKVAGSKDLWILDTEVGNASKFGYKGCCQLASAHLLENDGKKNSFDKNWIEETTIKEIMDTPVSENITTLIYKVHALVQKAEGTGFTNYYFKDIDEVTGSYTYTQCNGNDFAWLDEFDGKICTVFLSAINAKSNASGCTWRFFPIEVIDEGYTFNKEDAPKFAVDYYGVGQFEKSYTGDPKMEVITSVSQKRIDVENVKLEYSSNDENIISFDLEGDKLMMHAHASGTATITIKATYLTYTYSTLVQIECKEVVIPESITVKEVIDTDPAEEIEVVVRGIVGPSLVNKTGFYLIDETGGIAVTLDATTLATLSLGNEVVLKGTRTLFGHEDGFYGQSVLLDCELLVNLYGDEDYSTTSFDTSKTLDDLTGFDVSEDHTTEFYVVDVQIKVVDYTYYSNIYLVSPTTGKEMILYCSNSNQYSWLKKYAGKENGQPGESITIELALCNWNGKKQFPGCVLAVELENGEKEVNILNFSK